MTIFEKILDNLDMNTFRDLVLQNKDIIDDYDEKLSYLSKFHVNSIDFITMVGLRYEFVTSRFKEFYELVEKNTRFDIDNH